MFKSKKKLIERIEKCEKIIENLRESFTYEQLLRKDKEALHRQLRDDLHAKFIRFEEATNKATKKENRNISQYRCSECGCVIIYEFITNEECSSSKILSCSNCSSNRIDKVNCKNCEWSTVSIKNVEVWFCNHPANVRKERRKIATPEATCCSCHHNYRDEK